MSSALRCLYRSIWFCVVLSLLVCNCIVLLSLLFLTVFISVKQF